MDRIDTIRPTDYAETPEALKTWSDLKGRIKGLGDFLTAREEDEIEKLQKNGNLPESVDYNAFRRYVNYCNTELLPGINKNREEVGLPRLWGKVLDNAIMGDRWKRERAALPAWRQTTSDRVWGKGAVPKTGDWGHERDAHLRGQVADLYVHVRRALDSRAAVPSLKVVTEYYTYRGADGLPYGYAYSVRLEEQTERTVLEHLDEKGIDVLAEFVYRELPTSVSQGKSFEELEDSQRALYRFMVKKTIEGLGVTAGIL